MKTKHGFTLIEMLTVIVIVGIIIGIGIPVMHSLTRSTAMQGAVRQISNTAQLARQFAITHRVRTELRVINTWNAISVFTNNWPAEKWIYLPVGTVISNASDTSIIFKPTGDLLNSADKNIIVREGVYDTNTLKVVGGNSSNYAVITVSGIFGKVSIKTP